MKNCTACGYKNKEDAKYCLECGQELISNINIRKSAFCLECGQSLRQGALFCASCGKSARTATELTQNVSTSSSQYQSIHTQEADQKAQIDTMPQQSFRYKSQEEVVAGEIHVPKKRKKLKVLMLLAGILAVAILTTSILFDSVNLTQVFRRQDFAEPVEWVFDGDLDEALVGTPAKINHTSTKPIDISTSEGFRIVAQENALDKDRDFEIEQIEHEKLSDIAQNGQFKDYFAIDAFKMDAGLAKDEIFPGEVQVSFDLSRYDIPKEAYDDLRIIRYDDNGDGEIIRGYVDGQRYVAYTNANSVFVLSSTGVALLGIRVLEGERKHQEAFGTERRIISYNLKDDSTYTLLWPERLGIGNPDAVMKMVLEKIDIYKKLGFLDRAFTPSLEGEDKTNQLFQLQKQFRDHFMEYNVGEAVGINDISHYNTHMGIINKIHTSDLYKAHSEKYDYLWKKENIWPIQVNYVRKQLIEADKYLFEYRGLKKPRSADILITDKNISSLGMVINPLTMRPYMILRTTSQNVIENPSNENNKRILDEYLITITHELLHLAQSGRYRALMYDFNSNTWFWEATAILLEFEAKDYYQRKGILDNDHVLDRHNYYEAYLRPPGLLSYIKDVIDNPDALVQSGYMGGYLLLHLRNRYYGQSSGERANDNFLPNLLEDFSRTRIGDALYVIIRQTSNSQKKAKEDFRAFYEKKAEKIEDKVMDVQLYRAGNSELEDWVEDVIDLDENNQVAKIVPTRRPFSNMMRTLNLKYDKEKYDDDVKLVFIRSQEKRQADEKLPIYIALREGDFEHVKHEKFKVFNNISAFDSIAIQEIHAYSDGWFSFQEPYLALLMFRPEPPKLEVEETRSGKNLVIRMPERSNLFSKELSRASRLSRLNPINWVTGNQNNIVNKWRLQITDPLGQQSVITTDEDVYRVPLSSMDGSIDFSDPTIRSGLKDAIGGVLQGDESLREGVQEAFGGNLDSLIDAIDMGEDLDDMIDAAQILQTGGTEDTYKVSISEVLNVDEAVFGPESKKAKLEHRIEAESADLTGVWEGTIMFTSQKVRITIKEGEGGHQYIMVMNSFDDGLAYLDYVGNGRLQITAMEVSEGVDIDRVLIGVAFDGVTMTLNNKDQIRMFAPPVTLSRQ